MSRSELFDVVKISPLKSNDKLCTGHGARREREYGEDEKTVAEA